MPSLILLVVGIVGKVVVNARTDRWSPDWVDPGSHTSFSRHHNIVADDTDRFRLYRVLAQAPPPV